MITPYLLERYRIDRTAGATLSGPTQLVVLVVKGVDGPEQAFAMSKVDAAVIGQQLLAAAGDAQKTQS